jgi:steroid delta-isomerase
VAERKTIETAIQAYCAAWAAKDRKAWLATFAESAMQEDPVGSRVRHGRREIGEFWDAAMAAYDSLEIVPRNIFIAGDEAALEWTINAVMPLGRISFNGVDVFEFDRSGLIISVRAFWVPEQVAEQRRHCLQQSSKQPT